MWYIFIPIISLHISCHVSADIYIQVNAALHLPTVLYIWTHNKHNTVNKMTVCSYLIKLALRSDKSPEQFSHYNSSLALCHVILQHHLQLLDSGEVVKILFCCSVRQAEGAEPASLSM